MQVNDVQIEIQGTVRDGISRVVMAMNDHARNKWVAVDLTPAQAEQVAELLKAGVDRAAVLLGGSILGDVEQQCKLSTEDLEDIGEAPGTSGVAGTCNPYDEETGRCC